MDILKNSVIFRYLGWKKCSEEYRLYIFLIVKVQHISFVMKILKIKFYNLSGKKKCSEDSDSQDKWLKEDVIYLSS